MSFLRQVKFGGLFLVCALASCVLAAAPGAGTAFSYQGRLLESGIPANGAYDLQFSLFTAPTNGSTTGAVVNQSSVAVSNGLFTVLLDFGTEVFTAGAYWLEIGVRPSGSQNNFVTLVPRQPLTPAPYSIYTLKAESLAGPLPESQLPANVARLNADQTFTGVNTFGNRVGIGTPVPSSLLSLGPGVANTKLAIYEDLAGNSAVGIGYLPGQFRLHLDNATSRFSFAGSRDGPEIFALHGSGNLDVKGSVNAASFSGNGAGLSNVTATAFSSRAIQQLWRTPIVFVNVTNAGNGPDDRTGYGAVPYNFRIGKFEINNNQYVAFLNAVAAEDTYQLYTTNMFLNQHGGIERSGAPGDYTYAPKPGMGHKAVTFAGFWDAVRFVNWLHNGQPVGPQDKFTTEDGAYTLTSENALSDSLVRNPNARFWVPTENEWYKAAYHHPQLQGGPPGDYWLTPIRSDFPPISEPPPGNGFSGNTCCGATGTVTDIGAYLGSASYYGTYDQGGNVVEWNDAVVFPQTRAWRGGGWSYDDLLTFANERNFDSPEYEGDDGGFRVAGAIE